MTEAAVLKQVTDWLKGQEKVDVTRVNDNHVKGKPDIIACVNGCFVGIELKRPGGTPSVHQLKKIAKIREAGGFADVFDNLNDVKSFIRMVKSYDR